MCGIVGYIGERKSASLLLEGLKKLEYRGYDSAGIALLDDDGEIQTRRTEGKLSRLVDEVRENPCDGTLGIGHTHDLIRHQIGLLFVFIVGPPDSEFGLDEEPCRYI